MQTLSGLLQESSFVGAGTQPLLAVIVPPPYSVRSELDKEATTSFFSVSFFVVMSLGFKSH